MGKRGVSLISSANPTSAMWPRDLGARQGVVLEPKHHGWMEVSGTFQTSGSTPSGHTGGFGCGCSDCSRAMCSAWNLPLWVQLGCDQGRGETHGRAALEAIYVVKAQGHRALCWLLVCLPGHLRPQSDFRDQSREAVSSVTTAKGTGILPNRERAAPGTG